MKSLHPKSYISIILKNISKCNGFLLFNSLSKLQTKPLPSIRHICAFSRDVLNVRSTRSHPTLAQRPQIWIMKFTGFCAVAGENELNRGEGIWGQKLMYSAYSRMTGNRGDGKIENKKHHSILSAIKITDRILWCFLFRLFSPITI